MGDQRQRERWRRVEALYHQSLTLPVAARAPFLRDACGDDGPLREEVEALLAVADEAEHFLEDANDSAAAPHRLARESLVGQDLGPYHIVALLGAGGMGAVYRATDARLGRDVALKVLHHAFNADPDHVGRFDLEARATALLNHPNILAIFDVGLHEGRPYFVTELLDGETLREALGRGRLPVREALGYAVQIASGLAAAHDKGIVHRDVKPDNIFITSDGRAKLLDFGVAKLVEGTSRPQHVTADRTRIGTIGYMSPEQVRGDPVDARSDIFGLGAVLYEMVTGRRAFACETAAVTPSGVLYDEPPYDAPDRTPAVARTLDIARRCLQKSPAARFHSCHDVALVLSDVMSAAGSYTATRSRWRTAAVATVLVVLGSVAAAWIVAQWSATAGSPPIHSIAVLPLESLSRGPDDELFADGMTGALITNLAKIRALRVVSRTSAMRFKHTRKTLEEIGRELNVDAVVEGSIERVGARVRISAQLIRTAADAHLWADTYDRDVKDILMLQDEVARSIAREIRVTLTPEERAGLATARVVDPTAYALYLKGRFFWNERTKGSIDRAIAYFLQAIERDPSYAAAHSGLADCYLSLGFSFDVGSVPPRDAIPKAKAAALKALALDESLAEAHNSLAYAKLNYDWDWPGAEAEFRRALALNPGSAEAHHWYAHWLVSRGMLDESLAESERALALDQLNPIINVHLGWNYFFARQYDKAVTQLNKTVQIDPNYGLAYWYRGLAYEQLQRYDEALTDMRRGAALLQGNVVVSADIGHVHAASGQRGEAERVIEMLQKEAAQRYVSPFEIALIYVALGETDRAFAWLDKAYQDRSDLLVYLDVEPRLDPVRSDPRFKELATKVGLRSRAPIQPGPGSE
jgi:eukaryotic-like serine/threonine-protein kinase